jgi:beta-D-xylosidase 4
LAFVVPIEFLIMRSSTLAAVAAMAASTMAQNNASYYDYTTEGNPQLDKRTLATIPLSFPDCGDSPLTDTLVCNTSASAWDRASALISMFTLEELVNNTVNTAPGVPRLGLPPYEVWNEALHGLSHFYKPKEGDFSWVTAFPQPITSMASMNRSLIHQIGSIISTQGRAASNAGRYGLNVYSPNINGFRAPVWGRGQETPGEDAFFLSSLYAYEYITAMQGGVGPAVPKLVSVVKHFAGYDIETWRNHSRLGNDVNITQQDLAGYYTPQFRTSILQAKAKGLMCSYNAVNGEASCSSSFFLQTLLRDTWGFGDGFVSGDCGAVYGVFNPHGNAATRVEGSATALLAGTDIDCGTDFSFFLEDAFAQGNVSRNDIELAVTRLYSQLVKQGYFDGNGSMYRDLTWDDVLKTDAWNISYEAAVEGIVLLKNDDTLPLKGNSSVALIGPYANATDQMLGNYFTTAPYTISPLGAFKASGRTVNYALGTGISSNNETFFDEALAAARKSDVIVFAGGIDNTVESEALDRENITWPGNQLDLIDRLSKLGKPVVVLQMGGGQVDSTVLKENDNVNSIIWGGYPGQSGGQALYDLISGKRAPAGRLVTTQYPAAYADDFYQLDMDLRPSGDNPGQTYMWYTGEPVYAFGHGLFYTTFEEKLAMNASASQSYNITKFFAQPHGGYEFIEQMPLLTFQAEVSNTGMTASDYSAMLFASTTSGPTPRPIKWLVGITREAEIAPGGSSTVAIDVPVGVLARAAENGDLVVYPGDYSLALNNERSVVMNFTLTDDAITVAHWPSELPDNDKKPQA